jgi:prevent-host-death family protein
VPTTSTVSFRDLRKNLSGFLRQARQGEEIIVTSRGQVVARIVPPAELARRPIGVLKGQIHMADDFDETPSDLIAAMEGDDA